MEIEAPPPHGSFHRMPLEDQERLLGFRRAKMLIENPELMKRYKLGKAAEAAERKQRWLEQKKAEWVARQQESRDGQ